MLLAGAVLLAVLLAGESSHAMLASARLSCYGCTEPCQSLLALLPQITIADRLVDSTGVQYWCSPHLSYLNIQHSICCFSSQQTPHSRHTHDGCVLLQLIDHNSLCRQQFGN